MLIHIYISAPIERGEKNVALLNLAKIAEASEVDISQIFTYTSVENNEESQAGILKK